jgi:hypothetical protein
MRRFLEAACRRPSPELDSALSFFNFKMFAASWAATRIREMPRPHYVIEQEPTSSGLNRVRSRPDPRNDAIEAQVNVYFDLFLLEIAAVVDALAQLANAAFALGQRPKDVCVASAHARLRERAGTENTGLRDWNALGSSPDNWWWRLNDYRNQIAHRRFLAFSQILRSLELGGDNPTQGRVPVELLLSVEGGPDLPLLAYVDESEGRVLDLADATLHRFSEFLS